MVTNHTTPAAERDGKATRLRVVSCTVKAARRFVAEHHRHLPKFQGGLFACALMDGGGRVRGVAVAGNPARVWTAPGGVGTARLVVTRVATDGVAQGCSMLYGAMCRAARALGWLEVWTYTLPEEPGTSLRAAGFQDMGLTDGGEHDRPSRRRKPAVRADRKRRWRRVLAQVAA